MSNQSNRPERQRYREFVGSLTAEQQERQILGLIAWIAWMEREQSASVKSVAQLQDNGGAA